MTNTRLAVALWLGTACCAAMATAPSAARAQDDARISVDLPEQPLASALRQLALISGRTVIADATTVSGRRSPALKGNFTLREALVQLLAGSGLTLEAAERGFVVSGTSDDPGEESTILVAGSRIRGARIASPVTVLTEQDLRDTGFADLGEVARSLPQSFGGGQNPGVGRNVPQSAGQNVGASSSVNLRGLGSDATLTILNGRRLPYDGVFQGIDISAIPMVAVSRMEVVADGSSAIYGSDAVAGVVNVVLRDDYDGILTRARLGGAPQGGGFQKLFSAMAGSRWNDGGAFLAYEYSDTDEVNSSDRPSTRVRPNQSLLPGSTRNAVAGHAHQDLASNLVVEMDGLYNHRVSGFTYPMNDEADLSLSRADQRSRAYTLALAGTATLTLGAWNIAATTTFGRGRTRLAADYTYEDGAVESYASRFSNRSFTGELAVDGTLLALPGGSAKLAAGAGWRNNGFETFTGAGSLQNFDTTQNSRYAFAELGIPIVAPGNDVPLIHALDISAAMRYEDYRRIGDITTPKLGIVYAPASWLDLRASWGKSFRAPSFYDLYGVTEATVYPASRYGGTGYPADALAVRLIGGNPDLKPERATSWSATLALHPASLKNTAIELTYFSTRYRDRVVAPITVSAQALSSPAYASQVTFAPTAEQLANAISQVQYFNNYSGYEYDPAAVVALIDGRNTNVGQQKIDGIDLQARWKGEVAGGELGMNLGASYLESEQQISPAQPVEILAGRLFSPAHWRGRGGIAFDKAGLRLSANVSYTSGIQDYRTGAPVSVRGMTTLDLGGRYRFDTGSGLLKGLELALTVENVTNVMPAQIATSFYYESPYDSTNYSPLGRFVAFEVTKSW